MRSVYLTAFLLAFGLAIAALAAAVSLDLPQAILNASMSSATVEDVQP